MTEPLAGVAAEGLRAKGTPTLRPEQALAGARFAPAPPPLRVPDQARELTSDTAMQKVVLPGLVELTLGNVTVPRRFDPHRISGFVMRLEDVPPSSSFELGQRLGLDQVADWPVTNELHVLRFYAHSPQFYIAPFECGIYQVDLIELPAGTELWRIDSQGDEQRLGAYLNRQIGWVSIGPAMLGPAGWNRPPAPLRSTVRRGLVARYRGEDFDADFGPRPGEVTLHPLPGQRPGENFIDQAGTYTLPVMIDELERLDMVRWCGGWHGLPVELVDTEPERAVIHYIGRNGPRAAELGLAEVDYRVWRGCVPRTELADLTERRVSLR